MDRDTLRFLELTPDIKMSNVKIATNVAFPLVHESSERALTKDDFQPENAKVLLEKLGVPKEYLQSKQSCSSPALKKRKKMNGKTAYGEKAYQKLVCRYLGAHASISSNIEIDEGLEPLQIAIKGTEGGFEAQASESCPSNKDEVQSTRKDEVESMRKAVEKDSRMKEIRRAVTIPKFGKKFQIQNSNITLKDLKSDSQRFLKQLSTKSFPLFGLPVISSVIRAADADTAHQGAEAITEVLEKEKYLFFNEKGETLDLKITVEKHVQDCTDCSKVQEIKNRVPGLNEERLVRIPIKLERKVLLYADRRHQGFAEAHRRLKSWATFPNFIRKVFHFSLLHINK